MLHNAISLVMTDKTIPIRVCIIHRSSDSQIHRFVDVKVSPLLKLNIKVVQNTILDDIILFKQSVSFEVPNAIISEMSNTSASDIYLSYSLRCVLLATDDEMMKVVN